jgi:hypothetical protein
VHNQQSNFQNERKIEQGAKSKLKPIKGLRFEVLGLKDGKYRIVLWDTWKGEVAEEWHASCVDGRLSVSFDILLRDFCLIVERSWQ